MRVHILGICGTFMGGLALIAKELGFQVTGSDLHIYPPMSETLSRAGIEIKEGYDPYHLQPVPDQVIVGNTIKRGNPALEYLLSKGLNYTSGPQWLADHVLQGRHVLAVAGTHGKTTTSSMLAWILECAGLQPGYLIGGVAHDFKHTASVGKNPYFVIEADEYASAFCDRRSKFIHYRPRTLVINNLEFDHADIFPDLEAIKQQFQHLLQIVPATGRVIYPSNDEAIEDVLSRGCWAAIEKVGGVQGIWQARAKSVDGSRFELWHRDQKLGLINWALIGEHNINNALTAAAAAHDAGIASDAIIAALNRFQGVKRRMEMIGEVNGIKIYDDFAHHPTAITTTISGLRAKLGLHQQVVAVIQFGTNSMKLGVYRDRLSKSLQLADKVILLQPDSWDANSIAAELGHKATVFPDVSTIVSHLTKELKSGDHVLIMSNTGFDNIHRRLLDSLKRVHQLV